MAEAVIKRQVWSHCFVCGLSCGDMLTVLVVEGISKGVLFCDAPCFYVHMQARLCA